MQVLTVVGARPQFVKASVVSPRLDPVGDEFLLHTGQHYDEAMSAVFFEELEIPEPDRNLGVGSGLHGEQTGEMIAGIEEVLVEVDPDVLLLYGDTNSTLAGAIVGSKADVTVAHVEAGLRSGDREMPEEVNRILTDHAANLTMAPSRRAVDALADEGIVEGVYETGDVMYDAILAAADNARRHATTLRNLGLSDGEYVLATVHRPRNTDDPDRLAAILEGLSGTDHPVVLPAHPRTVDRLDRYGLRERAERAVRLIEPLGYLEFVHLLERANRVATDSGGVQKEAFFLETPCVTFRSETEWPETVDCGWNELVGADSDRIQTALEREHGRGNDRPEPYGDGTAAETVVDVLVDEVS